MIFIKIRLGKAISRARGDKKLKIFPGTMRRLIIQNPINPIQEVQLPIQTS